MSVTQDIYPLTEPQMGIMLEWIQHPDATQNNITIQYDFPLDIDARRLKDVVSEVLNYHSVFKTRLLNRNGQPYQYIDEDLRIEVQFLQMPETEYLSFRRSFIRPFNLWQDVLFRSAIVQTDQHIYLLNDANHIIADSGTWIGFHREMDLRYKGEPLDEITDNPFADVVREEQAALSSPSYHVDKAYYANTFSSYNMTLVPTPSPQAIGAIRRISYCVPSNEVDTFCTNHRVTPNLFYMAVYSIALAAVCSEEKVTFEGMNHGRRNRRQRDTYGMFVRTVPFYADLSDPKRPIVDIITSFKSQMMQNVRHGNYPFTHFCRDLHRHPVNSFSYQIVPEGMTLDSRFIPCKEIPQEKSSENISLVVYPNPDGDQIHLCYNEARYQQSQMQQMADMILNVTQTILHHPTITLGEIALVDEDQQQDLLMLGTGEILTTADNDILQCIDRQCQTHPNAIAVVDCEGWLTYSQLKQQYTDFAQNLKANGVEKGDVVALQMPRRKEFIVAALGTLMAGAAYLPLAVNLPQDNLDYICKDSGACCIISGSLQVRLLKGKPLQRDDIAYIIYTSGSTGRPKGVMIPRTALSSFVQSCAHIYQLTAQDRILCQGTFSFDASVEDLYPVLTSGGTLHILRQSLVKDIQGIAQYIRANAITGCNFTTVFGCMILELVPDLPLRYLTLGGEKLQSIPANLPFQVYNTYGPTEFTVDATFYACSHTNVPENIPIGCPVCNSMALVLNRFGHLLPKGIIGELCLAGNQLAAGYVNLPEQTQNAFVPMPFANTYGWTTMYRTGDLVRWNADNQLEYIGRNDHQIKLHGYRIELGEIESAVRAFEGISQVVARVNRTGDDEMLCLWYSVSQPVDRDELKRFLSSRLPDYMMPGWMQEISVIPLKSNDKVDFDQLPQPKKSRLEEGVVMPAMTYAEDRLVRLLSSILGKRGIGVTHDLFSEIGMNSIQAARFSFTAMDQGFPVRVSDLYSMRTIRQIANQITNLPSKTKTFTYWLEPPTDRPVVILNCGYIYLHPLYTDYIEYYKDRFDILILETFHEFFWQKEEIRLNDMMDEYMREIQQLLDGREVDVVTGLCYGAELGLLMAHELTRYQKKRPLALLFDPIYNRALQHDDATGILDPIIVERLRISNALGTQVFPPEYAGPMLIILAGSTPPYTSFEFPHVKITPDEKRAMAIEIEENKRYWKQHYPQADIHILPYHHFNLLSSQHLPDVVSCMKSSPLTSSLSG